MARRKKKSQEPPAEQEEKETQAQSEQEKQEDRGRLPAIRPTQAWCPVTDIQDGIVITQKDSYVKIMELSPNNFLLRSVNKQDAIANAFGSLIKIMPRSFQIKCLCKRANLNNHVAEVARCMAVEENERCRAMQSGTIRLIQQCAERSISRRFFLSFAYEEEGGLRRPSWEEITEAMEEQAQQIAMILGAEPTNNVCVSPAGDSEYVKEILYSILCRGESEHKTMEEKNDEVYARYLAEGSMNGPLNGPLELTIPVRDFISPMQIDSRSSRYLLVDGVYYAFAYVPGASYPGSAVAGWLAQYINMGDSRSEGVDVDMYISKEPTDRVRQKLVYAMRINKSRVNDTEDTTTEFDNVMSQVTSGYYIRSAMAAQEDFCFFSMMFTISARSRDELDKKVKWLSDLVRRTGLEFVLTKYRYLDAFASVLPINEPDKRIIAKARRNVMSGDLGSMYPFISSSLDDAGGILVGIMPNGTPVFLNPYDRNTYPSGNIAIFGTTGSGKTYTLQCIAQRLRQQQTQIIIIIPKKSEDYVRACKAIDGQFISIGPGSPMNINIMEIRKIDTTVNDLIYGSKLNRRSLLSVKIQQLLRFATILLPDIGPIERQIFEEACIATYKAFGITDRNKSLYDPNGSGQYRKMPILGDLYKELERHGEDARRLCAAFAPFVTGAAKSFNAPTNVKLDSKYVCIDISHVSRDYIREVMLIVTDYVNDVITADISKRKAVIFDELWAMIGIDGAETTAAFVLDVFKTIRSRNAIAIAATQDIMDYSTLSGGYGQRILNACPIKLVLKMEEKEAAVVAKDFGLSAAEQRSIPSYEQGWGLLLANKNHIDIHIAASLEEHLLITTNASDLMAILSQRQEGKK